MIYIVHPQRDEKLAELDRTEYWNDTHVQGLDGTHYIRFETFADGEKAQYITDRSRLIIQDDNGVFLEFVAHEIGSDDKRILKIAAEGSEYDLDKLKRIAPQRFEGYTLNQYAELAISGTGWRLGEIDYASFQTQTFDKSVGGFEFLRRVANSFDRELRFRVEVYGTRIAGRYVDLIERIGVDNRKEIVAGENLAGIERIVHSERIITALNAYGPEKEDGTQLYAFVTDEEAFQRWNREGAHLEDDYAPETDDQDMTLERLTSLASTALKKRIDSVTEYTIEAAVLPDDDVRLGDTLRIKDVGFNPPLYAEARAIRVERPINGETIKKTYTIGEIVELQEEDVRSVFRSLQNLYGAKIVRSEVEPPSTVNTNWIDTSGPIDIGKTYNVATQTWEKYVPTEPLEIGAVDSADFNGNTIATLLNAPDTNVQLIAKTLNLVGAVNVLSDITGNLGTITAGKIEVLQIEGGGKQIVFGADMANFDGRIDYNGGAMRFQSDGATYLKVNKGGTTGFNGTSTPTSVFQLYVGNTPLFNFGQSDEGFGHRTLQGGTVRLKFLNGSTPALQVRNVSDTALIPIHASELVTNSVRETKKNILPYTGDALTEIMTTAVHSYQLNEDTANDMKRIGLIYDESPVEIVSPSGFGIDVYAMATMNWRGTQQLKEEKDAEILALNNRIDGQDAVIESMQQQMQEMQQAIAELKGSVVAQ